MPSPVAQASPVTAAPHDGWLFDLLGCARPAEGASVSLAGQEFRLLRGILRGQGLATAPQSQSADAFQYKWHKRDTFDSAISLQRQRAWMDEKYGPAADKPWLQNLSEPPIVIDAGCGAGMSGLEYWQPVIDRIRYLGLDITTAVDVAQQRFAERGAPAAFLQTDLTHAPIPKGSVDVFFSEGVLHHTDNTRDALAAAVSWLKPNGRAMFYVYRVKGAAREFTDDHIRNALTSMTPEQAWKALEPLTQLGIELGKLGASITLERPIDFLGIPAGKHDVQRLFYWYVCKAYYSPDLSFDEMNHINYDWFAPSNAHRHTPEEVRGWCAELGLEIEREQLQESGITIVARKVG